MYNENNENNEINISEEVSPETVAVTSDEKPVKKERKPLSKKVKYRINFSTVAVLFVAVFVAVNLLCGALSERINLNIDLTSGGLLSISDETKAVLKNLSKDDEITIYSLVPDNDGNEYVQELMQKIEKIVERYPQESSNITYKKIDTVANPDFLTPYLEDGLMLNQYSMIFECGDKATAVDLNKVLVMDSEGKSIESLSAEQEFTAAIVRVTSETAARVGVVSGHEEAIDFDTMDQMVLSPENYEAVYVDLYSGTVAEDIDLIIIPAPTKDFDPVEIETLDNYLDNGGRVQLVLESDSDATPNLMNYLKEWGVSTLAKGYVYETSPQRYIQYPTNILANVVESEITKGFVDDNTKLVYPIAKALDVSEVYGIESQNLLTSFSTAFAKFDPSTPADEKKPEDIEGPVVLSTILSKGGENPNRLMILGGSGIFSGFGTNIYANEDFYYNSIAYLTDAEGSVYIRPKDISPVVLPIPQMQANLIAILVVVVIPLAMLIAGFVVWNKRRHL